MGAATRQCDRYALDAAQVVASRIALVAHAGYGLKADVMLAEVYDQMDICMQPTCHRRDVVCDAVDVLLLAIRRWRAITDCV